jgi:hypothetical protein
MFELRLNNHGAEVTCAMPGEIAAITTALVESTYLVR